MVLYCLGSMEKECGLSEGARFDLGVIIAWREFRLDDIHITRIQNRPSELTPPADRMFWAYVTPSRSPHGTQTNPIPNSEIKLRGHDFGMVGGGGFHDDRSEPKRTPKLNTA